MFTKNLKLVMVVFIMLASFCINAMAMRDYIFDPKDPNHSIYVPDGTGPFPTILLLHGSTGVVNVNHDWATMLKNNGYVVYIIDSFKPRGWIDRESIGWEKATAAQLSDVVPAYQYLTTLPYVNANRIAVLGFSMGGFDVLRIMERNDINPESFQKIPFTAAASFYGVCHRLAPLAEIRNTTTIFIGTNDDRATTRDCEELVIRSNQRNKNVSIKTYQDALHGFDNFEFPASKEIIDEKGEHYHVGYNKQAREMVIKDLLAYFKHNL